MATISANVSKKELDAIREYANECGDSISNLMKKAIMQMIEPEEKEESTDDKLRKMLGLDKKKKSRKLTLEQLGEELGLVKKKDLEKYFQDFR